MFLSFSAWLSKDESPVVAVSIRELLKLLVWIWVLQKNFRYATESFFFFLEQCSKPESTYMWKLIAVLSMFKYGNVCVLFI